MSIVVEELLVELAVENPDSELEVAERKIRAFTEKDFPDIKLGFDLVAIRAGLKAIRTEYDELQAHMAGGLANGNTFTQGAIGAPGRLVTTPPPLTGAGATTRASTTNPAKIAATTAAVVEQIAKTTEAKVETMARTSAAQVSSIHAKSAADVTAREARTAAEVERIRVTGAERTEQRLARIQAENQERARLRAESAAKRSSARSQLGDKLSTGATMTGGAIIIGAAAASKEYVEYDRSLRNVNSIAKLTEEQLGALDRAVMKLSDNRNIRKGPHDLAQALYTIYSSGKSGAEGLDILEVAALGASGGLTTTETSAKVLLATLNSSISGVNNSREAMNVLFKIVDRGVLSFEDLANQIGTVLQPATAAGIPIQQLGAAYAVMTKQGMNAAETTTNLQNLITKLIRPPKEAQGAFDALGISYGISALKAKGLTGVLAEIEAKTGGNKQALAKLFPDMQAFNGALALLSASGRNYRTELAEMNKANQRTGALMEAVAKQNKGAAYEADMLAKDFRKLGIEVGRSLSPLLHALVSNARDAVKWFNALDETTRNNLVRYTAYAGVLLLVGGRIKGVVDTINLIKTAKLLAIGMAEKHAAAEVTAAATTQRAWLGAYAKIAARLAIPLTLGVLLGGSGYEWARKNGWLGMNEQDNPDAMTGAGNVGKRITNSFKYFGQYDSTSKQPIWIANGNADASEQQALSITERLRRKHAQEKADKATAQQEAHMWGVGIPQWRKEKAAANAPDPLANFGKKPSEGEKAADKAERQAKAAALRLEKDSLDDVAKRYEMLADATEKSGRRQIDALLKVHDAIRTTFGGLQSELQSKGVTGNPLGPEIQALQSMLRLRVKANGIAEHYGGVVVAARRKASEARAQLDAANGGDGRNADGSGVGSRSLAVANAARDMHTSNRYQAAEFVGHCQRLLRKTVEQVTPEFSRYFAGTASATMRNFQKAGIGGKPSQMGIRPGDLVYNGTSSDGAGHAMVVGPDGQFYDQYGANARPQAAPQWVVRPGGKSGNSRSKSAAAPQGTPRSAASSAPSGANPLLDALSGFGGGMNELPKGWGPEIKAGTQGAAARLAVQQLLQSEVGPALLNQVRANVAGPGDAAGEWLRKFANHLDAIQNPLLQYEATQGRIKELLPELAKQTKELAAAELERALQFKDLNPDADTSGAGSMNLSRESFARLNARGRELWNTGAVADLRGQADELATQGKDGEAYTLRKKAAAEFWKQWQSAVADARLEVEAAAAEVNAIKKRFMTGFKTEGGEFVSGLSFGATRGDVERSARTGRVNNAFSLFGASDGGVSLDPEAIATATRPGAENIEVRAAHAARMDMLQKQLGAVGSYGAENPELQIQLALLQRRNDLEEQNRRVSDTLKVNVDKRLAAYEQEIRAEQQIAQLSESRANAARAVEASLMLQKDLELISANTAAERLAIEQKYFNLLNQRRGVATSQEELDAQAAARQQTQVNDFAQRMRGHKESLRDNLAQAMDEGSREGGNALLRNLRAVADKIQSTLFTRLANRLMGIENDGPDFLDALGRKKQTPTTTGINGPVNIATSGLSIAGRLRASRMDEMPDSVRYPLEAKTPISQRKTLAESAAEALGFGGNGMRANTITIHATQADVHGALVNTPGNVGGNGASKSTGDQLFGGILSGLGSAQ